MQLSQHFLDEIRGALAFASLELFYWLLPKNAAGAVMRAWVSYGVDEAFSSIEGDGPEDPPMVRS